MQKTVTDAVPNLDETADKVGPLKIKNKIYHALNKDKLFHKPQTNNI